LSATHNQAKKQKTWRVHQIIIAAKKGEADKIKKDEGRSLADQYPPKQLKKQAKE
jgi:hypothetical protein